MRILILGASGGCGQCLVRQARERGHTVTAVARSAASFTAPEGVRVERGEVLEPGFLDRVVAGHDAVASALGIRRRNPLNPWSPITSPEDLPSRSAQLLVQAMSRSGVRRVCAISSAGVGDSFGRMNWVMKVLVRYSNVGVGYRGLAVMEEVYSSSGLDWQAVRPTRLTDGPLTGKVMVTDAFPMAASISRADVAGYMLDRLERGELTPRLPLITA
jgi:putative NADH-flavin reductase